MEVTRITRRSLLALLPGAAFALSFEAAAENATVTQQVLDTLWQQDLADPEFRRFVLTADVWVEKEDEHVRPDLWNDETWRDYARCQWRQYRCWPTWQDDMVGDATDPDDPSICRAVFRDKLRRANELLGRNANPFDLKTAVTCF